MTRELLRILLVPFLLVLASTGAGGGTTPSSTSPLDEGRVMGDRYFRELGLQRAEEQGFVFLVQGSVEDPAGVAKLYGEWLDELWRELRVDWLEKAGVLENGGARQRLVVVLDSAQTFRGYLSSHPAVPDLGRGAAWDPSLGAVVHFHDPTDPNRAAWRDRSDLMRAVVRMLLAEHVAEGVVEPASPWLVHGLAEWLGTSRADDPAHFGGHDADPLLMGELAARCGDTAGRASWWIDLPNLLDVPDERALASLPRRWFETSRELPPGLDDGARDRVFDAVFRAQSRLWVRFLLEGRDGKYAWRLPKLVQSALQGELGASQLRAVLAERDLRALEADYLDWVQGQLTGVTPTTGIAATSGPAVGASGENRNTLAVLRPDPRQRLASALWSARRGRLGAALDLLEEAATEPDLEARLARERGRLQALRAGRDAWLELLGTGDLDFWIPIDGKLRKVGVQRVRDGAVRFSKPVEGVAHWDVDDLDAGIVAANLGKLDADVGPEWLRPYGMLLAGEERWERYLRGDDADSEALREDAAGIPDLLGNGEALELLSALAGPPPGDPVAARAALLDVERLLALAPKVPLVAERRDALREVARDALAAQLAGSPWSELLNGEVTELEGGRVRVRYGFDREAELEDFVVEREVFAHRLHEDKSGVTPEDAHVRVAEGQAHFLGRIGVLHLLEMDGPTTGTFTWQYDPQLNTSTAQLPNVHLAIHTNLDAKARLAALDLYGAEVLGGTNPLYFFPEAPPGLFPDKPYVCKLIYDGASLLTVEVNGTEACHLAARGVKPGVASISSQSAYENHLDELVLEGLPTADGRARLVRRATERALAALGL